MNVSFPPRSIAFYNLQPDSVNDLFDELYGSIRLFAKATLENSLDRIWRRSVGNLVPQQHRWSISKAGYFLFLVCESGKTASQQPFEEQAKTAHRCQRHKDVPLEQLRYYQHRDQYDPCDRLSQRAASDLDDCRQNKPHGCDRQTFREPLDPARIAQVFKPVQQRNHDVARQDDGECRDNCAGHPVEHVAYARDIKVRLPRRHARDRKGVEQLILAQNAGPLNQMSLKQRDHDGAIAEGHQVEERNEQRELPETHFSEPFFLVSSSTSIFRKANAPRTPPASRISAGLSRRKSARVKATPATMR